MSLDYQKIVDSNESILARSLASDALRMKTEIATLRSQLAEAREIIKPFAEARTYAKDRDGKPLKVFGINPSEVDYQRAKEFYDRAVSTTTTPTQKVKHET